MPAPDFFLKIGTLLEVLFIQLEFLVLQYVTKDFL